MADKRILQANTAGFTQSMSVGEVTGVLKILGAFWSGIMPEKNN